MSLAQHQMTSRKGFLRFSKMATVLGSHVILTDKIRQWIRILLTTAKLPNDTKEEFRKYAMARRPSGDTKPLTVPFNLVKHLHELLGNEQGAFVNSLIYTKSIPTGYTGPNVIYRQRTAAPLSGKLLSYY